MNRSPLISQRRRRGSALILVFWCLVLLTMAVLGVVDLVQLSVENTTQRQTALDAHALALSGLALGLHPQLLKNDPLLHQQGQDGGQFNVTLGSEGAHLNLNYILNSGHREILVNLFNQWGLDIGQADHVADCLFDWVTPGDLRSLNGAKDDDYAEAGLSQRPSYQPFVSMNEVALVMGMDILTKVHPNWRESFTLWSAGPLNVNEASPDLIAAIFGLDPKRVGFLTAVRNGRDGIAGTPDDVPIPDPKTLQSDLGVSDLTMKALGSQVSFNDPYRRVESVGQAQGVKAMISVVTRLNSSPPQYLLWSEQ